MTAGTASRNSSARGVVFVAEPRTMGYGGIDAVFEDGCGNLLNLHQDDHPAEGDPERWNEIVRSVSPG